MDGKTILPRSEVPEEFTWDLRDVFASDEAWNEELEALKAYPERLAAFAGTLGESAKTLLDWFTLSDEITVRVSKFVQYASCRSDQDVGNSFYQGMRSKAFSTAVALNSAGSFEASEIMAIFCLATSISDLKERLSKIVCAYTYDGKPVTAGDIGAAGAMTALLKDALDPNLVQTLENNPAIIHGGPFANIAHGCNSVMATKLSLSLADYVITEAGFGADLGAEKFLDIKCRHAGIAPSACVLVATLRALKSHGGVAKADLNTPNLEAVKKGAANLVRHIDNMKNGFGLPVVVAINAFPTDTAEEQAYVEQVCAEQGVPCVLSEVFAKGGEGGKALAEKVLDIMEDRPIQYTYPLEMPLKDKINAIATKIYRADGVNYSAAASKTLAELTELGYGDLPVCIAKTQYSFSDNAKLTGAPTGFTMEVREVRLAAGAGFVVVICGSIMTMPGLPKKPAAVGIDVDADGKITGLF